MKYRIKHLLSQWDVPIETWEKHWGFVDFTGKRVMDVGADWGRTADYFLQRGAKIVIAVEGKASFYAKLLENSKIVEEIIPVHLSVGTPADFIKLIKVWTPELLQVNCERCEKNLFPIPDEVFSTVNEYLVETHTYDLKEAMIRKCAANNYEILRMTPRYGGRINDFYAVKSDKTI